MGFELGFEKNNYLGNGIRTPPSRPSNEFVQFSFSNEAHLNSVVLPSFNCLHEINNGIHIYQFAFELLYLFPDVVVVSDLNKNIGGSTDWRKTDTDWRIYPPPIPLLVSQMQKSEVLQTTDFISEIRCVENYLDPWVYG